MAEFSSGFKQPSLNTRSFKSMGDWGGAQNIQTFKSSPADFSGSEFGSSFNPGNDSSYGLGMDVNEGFGDNGLDFGLDDQTPTAEGGWTKGVGMGIDVAKVGLGVYNALEQSKMNKFMRGYYGDQMDMMQTDFSNAAQSANENLSSKRERVLSAQGKTTGTDANRSGVASYMDQWGAQETV